MSRLGRNRAGEPNHEVPSGVGRSCLSIFDKTPTNTSLPNRLPGLRTALLPTKVRSPIYVLAMVIYPLRRCEAPTETESARMHSSPAKKIGRNELDRRNLHSLSHFHTQQFEPILQLKGGIERTNDLQTEFH